ncbi:polysaccharide biosynthesis/export family protein [Microvirga arabica]|uniref:polysaccharide biosynthesis/export family protein n=1 Tax=Microvirga arabica TaxID=1128671 RepID=UPI001939B2A6|nr:polysaccharide biosynthesis/export family protein [Microvirga arabica]MBM1175256.1 polysaccharide biosynthesis/export family protein [Microvirga arabica]
MSYGRSTWVLRVLSIGLVTTLPTIGHAADYQLTVQDKIRVKVVEWRAGKNEYHEWSGIGGEYVIAPSGTVQIPLVGDVPAEGSTSVQVAEFISEALQKRFGMANKPSTVVQIVQYRPVYVVGDVEKPGEYSFRPGLTVLQAVGMAGGERRITDTGLLRLERERITTQASVEAAQNDLRRAYARHARLQAELSGIDHVPVPKELEGDPKAEQWIASERDILQSRRESLRSQREVLTNLKDLLSAEVSSLNKKIQVQIKQVALARQELSKVNGLVEKGLAVSSREFALERVVADLEGRLLDYETAILRAKQGINGAVQKEVSLENETRGSLLVETQQAEANIESLNAKLRTATGLLEEAVVTAPMLAAERWKRDSWKPVYTLVRQVDGQEHKTTVSDFTSLSPNDVVHVALGGVEDVSAVAAESELREALRRKVNLSGNVTGASAQ